MTDVTNAGAIVAFTQTFVVSSSVTTGIPLIGQVLNNGATNFLGYNSGSADYLLPSSTAGATPTTLADGNTYYYSAGAAPVGITLVSGGGDGSMTVATTMPTTSASAADGSTGTSGGSSSPAITSSPTGSPTGIAISSSSSSSSSTSSGAGAAPVQVGGVASLILGFLSFVGMLV